MKKSSFTNFCKSLFIVSALAAPITICSDNVYSQTKPKSEISDKFSGEMPHYLVNIKQPNNDVDRIIEENRVFDSYADSYSISMFTNENITYKASVYGKKCEIMLGNYVQKRNEIRYFDKTGVHILNLKQLENIKMDIKRTLIEAADTAYSKQSKITERIIQIVDAGLREKGLLKDKKLEDVLSDKIEGFDGLTNADVLNIPLIEPKDFVPEKLYFGSLQTIKGVLGVTYVNTGLVGYDPLARQIDYVNGKANILAHELTHTNPKLQGIPEIDEFDAEFHASIVEDHNSLNFLLHQYLIDARKISKVLFSFDSELALKKAFGPKGLITGVDIRREILEDYAEKIKVISGEIKKTYLEEFLPEFYSHLEFWSSVNRELKDKNGAFKVFIYAKYEPTLLGGGKETKEWLEKNRLIINDATQKAKDEMKTKQEPIKKEFFSEEIQKFADYLGIKDIKKLEKIVEELQKVW